MTVLQCRFAEAKVPTRSCSYIFIWATEALYLQPKTHPPYLCIVPNPAHITENCLNLRASKGPNPWLIPKTLQINTETSTVRKISKSGDGKCISFPFPENMPRAKSLGTEEGRQQKNIKPLLNTKQRKTHEMQPQTSTFILIFQFLTLFVSSNTNLC